MIIRRTCVLLIFIWVCISCNRKENSTKIIAHRGTWDEHNAPENSIASLKESIKLGLDGSEFDVWMTKDSVLVVNHAPEFAEKYIETATYEELAVYNLSNLEKLPKLEDYLKTGVGQNRTKLVLEIKTPKISHERKGFIAQRCVELVEQLGLEDIVEYICFDFDIGLKIIELTKKSPVSYLGWKLDRELLDLKNAGFSGIDFHIKTYKEDTALIDRAKAIGLETNVWTVNDEADMIWFLEKGIDLITTDKPALLKEVMQR
ncbi:glycerophosphodiester phosphodiesterase [Echinicola salinicaeni]|uniref:glycerophosphodiester phosphodiesterase n=1 Tax=Echinicola salinicaeni TaxID=2762757 RepID=UPI00164957C3|nr:glycerophosphodiester phosphodiesterase family protein [Echinicola salinicaeni]